MRHEKFNSILNYIGQVIENPRTESLKIWKIWCRFYDVKRFMLDVRECVYDDYFRKDFMTNDTISHSKTKTTNWRMSKV